MAWILVASLPFDTVIVQKCLQQTIELLNWTQMSIEQWARKKLNSSSNNKMVMNSVRDDEM